LLSKNAKVVENNEWISYGSGNWFSMSEENSKLKVCGIEILRGIFGSKKQDIKG
jgi:hypothetical protein